MVVAANGSGSDTASFSSASGINGFSRGSVASAGSESSSISRISSLIGFSETGSSEASASVSCVVMAAVVVSYIVFSTPTSGIIPDILVEAVWPAGCASNSSRETAFDETALQ